MRSTDRGGQLAGAEWREFIEYPEAPEVGQVLYDTFSIRSIGRGCKGAFG